MLIFWGGAIVVFLILEAATAGIASIWFALGSLASLICAALNAPLWLQILWFVLVSGGTLYFTRPLAKKYVNQKAQPTNADMNLGMQGIVTETINNLAALGSVKIGGKLWTARSNTGSVIAEGTLVVAIAIEGVKLIVQELPRGSEATE